MEQYGTENMSAYLRKIAIDGYVVNLELPELGRWYPCCAGPQIISISSLAASMRLAAFMMPIWRNCGGTMTDCGERRGKF